MNSCCKYLIVVIAIICILNLNYVCGNYNAVKNLTWYSLQPSSYNNAVGAVEIAAETMNLHAEYFPDYKILVKFADTNGFDATNTIRRMLELSKLPQKPTIVMGPNAFQEAAQSIAQDNDMVNIAMIGSPSSLSDKTLYPTFVRVDPPSQDQAQPFLDLCLTMGWNRITYIADVTNYLEVSLTLNQLALKNNITIVAPQNYQTYAQSTALSATLDIRENLKFIKESKARIIFLIAGFAQLTNILAQLDEFGMTKAPYQLIILNEATRFDAVWIPGTPYYDPKNSQRLEGALGLLMPYNPTKFAAFGQRWIEKVAQDQIDGTNIMAGFPVAQLLSANVHDAAYVGLMALHNLTSIIDNCPSNSHYSVYCQYIGVWSKSKIAFDIIINSTYDGVSGFIKFNQYGDRIPAFSIVNFHGTGLASRRIIGQWKPETGIVIPDMNEIYWTNGKIGYEGRPPAIDPGIQDGDKVYSSVNAVIIIFTYVLAFVGSWAFAMLYEQFLFEVEKKTNNTKDNTTIMGSHLMVSSTLAISCIWGVDWLTVDSLSFTDDVTLNVSYLYVLISIPIVLILVYTAVRVTIQPFILKYKQVQNSVQKYKTPNNRTIGNNNEDKATPSFVAACTLCVKNFSVWSLLGVIIVLLTQLIMHICLISSFQFDVEIEYSVGPIIAGIVLLAFCTIISFQWLTYIHNHRWIASALLAAGIVISNQFALLSMNYTYKQGKADNSYVWTQLIIRIITAVLGSAICFIYLAILFRKLQLSRGTLRNELTKASENAIKLDNQIIILKSDISHLYSVLKAKSFELDLANWIRHTRYSDLIAWPLMHFQKINLFNKEISKSKDSKENTKTDAARISNNNHNSNHNNQLFTDVSNLQGIQVVKNNNNNQASVEKDSSHTGTGNGVHIKSGLLIDADNSIITKARGGSATGENTANPQELELANTKSAANNPLLYQFQLLSNKVSSACGIIPATALENVTLDDILTEPICLGLFKDSCAKDLCTENIDFILMVNNVYKSIDKYDNNALRLEELKIAIADSIYHQFIEENCDTPINIGSMQSRIVKDLIKKKKYTFDMFDPIVTEVINLLKTNSFAKFQEKPEFQYCALVLGKLPTLRQIAKRNNNGTTHNPNNFVGEEKSSFKHTPTNNMNIVNSPTYNETLQS